MTAPRARGKARYSGRLLAAVVVLLAAAGLCRCASGGAKPESPGAPAATTDASPPVPAMGPELPGRVNFATHILPLLQQKCSPCHFQGGRMYDRLPFDQEGTIRLLGTQMFTRLRDPLDQELIRAYLERP